MHVVVFGLTISSAWGNGHATLWRGLCRALADRGHLVTFFERDVPYYAAHRDTLHPAGCDLRLYGDWYDVRDDAEGLVRQADVAMVTSYCPDAVDAYALVCDSAGGLRTFYDLDTPVTLHELDAGRPVAYLPPGGLGDFDLVLSYTGGAALDALRTRLGARQVAPLYGSADPETHHPVPGIAKTADLSYLGTFAADRQAQLEMLFLEPARLRPARRFVLGGSMYPPDFPWLPNVYYMRHMPPGDHPVFYGGSSLTLNVTRGAMAAMGFCPSGRMFEASACGTAIVSDWWEGLERFFEPGEEIFIARTSADCLAALDASDEEKARTARAARERTLACHTAMCRVRELERILDEARAGTLVSSEAAGVGRER